MVSGALTRLSTSSCEPDPMSGDSITVSFILRFPTVTIGEGGAGQGIRGRSRSLQRASRATPQARLSNPKKQPAVNLAGGLVPVISSISKSHLPKTADRRLYAANRLKVCAVQHEYLLRQNAAKN